MSDRVVYAVGATVLVEWELIAAGVRSTGLAGTTTVRVFDETNAAFSTPAITELSLGGSPRAVYQSSFVPDAVGQWHVTIDETSGPFALSASYEVVAAADVDSARLATLVAGVNVSSISGDTPAADALETMLDGTGGNVLTLSQLRINSGAAGGAIDIDNTAGPAISARTSSGVAVEAVSTGGNGPGIAATGQGSGQGIIATAGATGDGVRAVGGATSGDGISAVGSAGNARGINAAGQGSGAGLRAVGGATGHGVAALGGATSGDGLNAAAQTAGDGIEAVGVGGGADINADILGSITGSLSGSVGSVTGAVGSVTNPASIATAVDAAVTASHGVGSYVDSGAPPSVTAIVNGVLDEATAAHATAGTVGKAIADAAAGGAGLTQQQVADALNLAPSAGAVAGSVNDQLVDIKTCACSGGGSGLDVEGI